MNDFKHWFNQKNETYKRNWLNLKVREDIDANTFRHEFEKIQDEFNILRGIYYTHNNPELNLPQPPIPRLTVWRGIGPAPDELMALPPPLIFDDDLAPEGRKRKSKTKKNKQKKNKQSNKRKNRQ